MPEQKIDLNQASKEDLMSIPGIGEERADLIIELREAKGGLNSVDDLKEVPGFAERLPEMIHENFTVGGQ